MRLLIKLAAAVSVLLVGFGGMAMAETLTLHDTLTVFDGSIFGGNGCDGEFPFTSCKYYNMGGFSYFDVGKNVVHGSSEYRSIMGFDFSDMPDHDSIEIDSAILTLNVMYAAVSDSLLHIGFRSLKHDVIEGTAQVYRTATDSSFTWSARIFMEGVDTVAWQIPGAGGAEDREDSIYAVSPGIGSPGTYRLDITELITHWMDSSTTVRWCLLADTCAVARPYARKVFYSSEYSTESDRPKLEVFYQGPGTSERPRHNTLTGGLLK
jgi:hypothetical protein